MFLGSFSIDISFIAHILILITIVHNCTTDVHDVQIWTRLNTSVPAEFFKKTALINCLRKTISAESSFNTLFSNVCVIVLQSPNSKLYLATCA
jgi:hypothetical protein